MEVANSMTKLVLKQDTEEVLRVCKSQHAAFPTDYFLLRGRLN